MSRIRLEPFFLDTSFGSIFLLLRAPAGAHGCVLVVPPFGEEMNKCRRQVTVTAELLVSEGYAVLIPDLFGTGDSQGEFHEATWTIWRDNIASSIAWSAKRGRPVDAVLATRLGCVLAAAALVDVGHAVRRTVFWQPVDSGRQFMTQLLRLRVASSLMQAGGRETVEELRKRFERGETIEVAGYLLGQELWRDVERLELAALLDKCLGRLSIWEVGRSPEGELSVPGRRLLQSARDRGMEASAERLPGEPFWSSTEIVTHPALASRTVRFLTSDEPR